MNMEEMYVCDCCSLLVANGDMCEDCGCDSDHKPMSNVEDTDGWYRVYCDHEKDDMEDYECEGYAPDCSDPWHRETAPGWTCPGCGIVLGMFYDIWKIRK